jgi:carboxypeptidase family protein
MEEWHMRLRISGVCTRGLFSLALILAVTCAVVWAQATAQINGTVKDQTGAVLPGAEITVTQTDTGISRNTITDETGSFVLPNLATGPYRLEATLPGFRTYAQSGIVLQVNASPVINVVLQVGQVSEQVEVQANAALVETRRVGVGQVIENERILELPLNGRNAADLIVLSGAAVQTSTADQRTMQGSVRISVGGGLSYGLAFTLDGATHNNPWDGGNLPLPFPDALQEFKVETSGLSAQNGMHSGGAVNAVVKSGTNEWHGDLFEFVRNGKFNARNAFANANDSLKRNQFGGTVGGPIRTNKLFFFAGYQGTTLRQDPSNNISFVPTPAMLSGDFTAFASAACNTRGAVSLRAPFVGNRIDPARFSKAALNVASKLPKTDDPCGRIVWGSRTIEDHNQIVNKVDYQLNTKHSLFGRAVATFIRIPPPYGPGRSDNLLATNTPGYSNLAQSYAAGDTYLASANMVNSFRLAVNRTSVARQGAKFFNPTEVGINMFPYQKKYTTLTVTPGFAVGGANRGDNNYWVTTYQATNDLSFITGGHQMSFGANVAHWREQATINSASTAPFTFNGQTTGLALADFLTGNVTNYNQNAPTPLNVHQSYIGLYAQDAWKVTPRLTLTYGIRWEPFLPQEAVNGKIYHFEYDAFQKGIKTQQFKNAPAGLFYPGDPGFPSKSGFNKHWLTLGPRLGLAWDVNGDGKTSVRASYGLANDFVQGQYHINTVSASPWGAEINIDSPPGGLDNPWLGYPGGNPFPYAFDANAPYSLYGFFFNSQYNTKPTYSQSWNLSVQRQLGQDWLVSTSYLGTRLVHIWQLVQKNPAVYLGTGPCTLNGVTYSTCSTTANTNQRRKLTLEKPQDGQYFGVIEQVEAGGVSHYHGLLLSVQRRAARGINVGGNYTWSHCNGDGGSAGGYPGTGADSARLFANDRRLDRGNCTGDRRHVFNVTAVAETPQFGNPKLRMLATGWRLSGIYKRSSGAYLTLSTGLDRALSGLGTGTQRPNQVLLNVYGDKSLQNWLNPLAFAQPALGTDGNVGRSSILGPGTWDFDVALSRVFRVREAQRLEFRAETFNVTNSVRKGTPATSLNSNIFGQINSSLDARVMQFALKYIF